MWEDFRLGPQLGIVRFGMGKDRPTSHPHKFARSHNGKRRLSPLPYKPSLGQRHIRQGWEASLPDVGSSKFMRVGRRSILAHPKTNNTWLGAETKVLPQIALSTFKKKKSYNLSNNWTKLIETHKKKKMKIVLRNYRRRR